MKLSDRIQLIDDMIRENPDYTIKDYLELVKELEGIKKSARQPIIKQWLKKDDKEITVRAMAERYAKANDVPVGDLIREIKTNQ